MKGTAGLEPAAFTDLTRMDVAVLSMKENQLPLSVLVVEEDEANSLCELLQLVGYRVSVARTGQAALRTARMDRPDNMLLDIRLPDTNGWGVAQRMRDMASGGP